jgi:hypothetical protein
LAAGTDLAEGRHWPKPDIVGRSDNAPVRPVLEDDMKGSSSMNDFSKFSSLNLMIKCEIF